MITVVIPSYNSEATIDRCLQSLKMQSFTGRYEIILVDSSTDRTPEIVTGRHSDVTFTHLKEKTDPGTARNLGASRAQGDVIAFIDSDCVATTEWLERISESYCSGISAVGGAVRNGNQEGDLIALAGYIAEFREFIPGQPKREVRHIPTCNISYRKEIFESFGGFNKEYYPQEDLVFNYRLHAAGEKIIFDPSIQVYHHHRSKWKEYTGHQLRIGNITSRILKKIPLHGSTIARNKAFAIPLVPLLPLVKFVRTVDTFMRYEPSSICRKPQVLGIFAIGLIYWAVGFTQGIFAKD